MSAGAENPFRDLRDDTASIVMDMLERLRALDEGEDDQIYDWIALYRQGRGEAGMEDWRWWIGEVDGESYALDFATREQAIAAAPTAIERGDVHSEDGRFWIIEARGWDDMLNEGDDVIPFADRRNHETLTATPNA